MMSDINENDLSDQGLPDEGIEVLSALFDGELQGDAARFAIRRLGHDARWRQAIGNWQLAGDALRRQMPTVAPGDFASRVAAAVAVQSLSATAPGVNAVVDLVAAPAFAQVSTATATAQLPGVSAAVVPARRRRWLGGAALAASVAMVAMFIARPFSQDPLQSPSPGLAAAPSSIPAVESAAVASTGQSTPVLAPISAVAPVSVAGTAVAVAELPRLAAARRNNGQAQRAALRARARQPVSRAVSSMGAATALALNEPLRHAVGDAPVTNPFHPPAETLSRPWPRAVLPGATTGNAFTASYVAPAGSPSFYPFEPRLPTGSAENAAPEAGVRSP